MFVMSDYLLLTAAPVPHIIRHHRIYNDTKKQSSTARGRVTYFLWGSATFPSPFLPTDTFFDCVSEVFEAESSLNIPAFPGTAGDKIQSFVCGNHRLLFYYSLSDLHKVMKSYGSFSAYGMCGS